MCIRDREDSLHKRVIGQDEAIITVSKAIRRSRSGLKDPDVYKRQRLYSRALNTKEKFRLIAIKGLKLKRRSKI